MGNFESLEITNNKEKIELREVKEESYLRKYDDIEGKKKYGVLGPNGEEFPLIKKFLNHEMKFRKVPFNTHKAQASDLSIYARWATKHRIRIDEVTIDILKDYRDFLEKTLKNTQKEENKRKRRTINRYLKTVLDMYRFNYAFGHTHFEVGNNVIDEVKIAKNDTSMLRGIHEGRKVTKNILLLKAEDVVHKEILTDEEVENIIENCTNFRDRLIISVLNETAIRKVELIGLQLQDIDIAKGVIHIKDRRISIGQDNKYRERTIPLSTNLINDLIEYITTESIKIDSDYLFNNFRGINKNKRMSEMGIDKMFRILKLKTNITRLHPHLFRTTRITKWAMGGISKDVVRVLAGHRHMSTTEKYYIKIPNEIKANALREAEERLILNEPKS